MLRSCKDKLTYGFLYCFLKFKTEFWTMKHEWSQTTYLCLLLLSMHSATPHCQRPMPWTSPPPPAKSLCCILWAARLLCTEPISKSKHQPALLQGYQHLIAVILPAVFPLAEDAEHSTNSCCLLWDRMVLGNFYSVPTDKKQQQSPTACHAHMHLQPSVQLGVLILGCQDLNVPEITYKTHIKADVQVFS